MIPALAVYLFFSIRNDSIGLKLCKASQAINMEEHLVDTRKYIVNLLLKVKSIGKVTEADKSSMLKM
jgi:hypothetical protein